MREIKFRAWNSKTKKMFNVVSLCISPGNFYAEGYSDEFCREGLILMQYTGLHDKNGREIFENDIVRVLYTDYMSKDEDDQRTYEQYLKDISEIKIVQWEFNGFYVSHRLDGYSESMSVGNHGFIEVIGNFYQNPELLER